MGKCSRSTAAAAAWAWMTDRGAVTGLASGEAHVAGCFSESRCVGENG